MWQEDKKFHSVVVHRLPFVQHWGLREMLLSGKIVVTDIMFLF